MGDGTNGVRNTSLTLMYVEARYHPSLFPASNFATL